MLSTAQPQQMDLFSAEPEAPLNELLTDDPPEHRYERTLREIFNDAARRGIITEFVDVLTWTLATIVVRYDNLTIAGDILTRLGWHIRQVTEWQRAQEEADQKRRDGVKPH
jgi:hypothetical protein